MIKNIIKRDGRTEPYIPSKLNSWGKWAAKSLGNKVDWSSVVIDAVSEMPENVSSSALQEKLIQNCLDKSTWSYYLMAGRLYAAHLHKTIFPNGIPTVKEAHDELVRVGLMVDLGYDALDYQEIESFIDHEKDFETPHFTLHYIRQKYSLRDKVKRIEYETQQFVYMRMAMALARDERPDQRIDFVKRYYDKFSSKQMSAPTPNFVNLGTKKQGLISCNLYTVKDSEPSLAVGDHIAYRMTAASAGIGSFINIRSKGDPVRGGFIEHLGKLPAFASLGKAVLALMQGSRGGAVTTYFSAYDPEVETIMRLRNQRSTENKKNRDLHYAMLMNKFLAKKALKNENAFYFNTYTAPDLMKALFSGDEQQFVSIYEKYEKDPTFKKEYFNPRDNIVTWFNEGLETGVAYVANIDEINRHTPFKEIIHSSNLCLEITEPTVAYDNMPDLYSEKEVGYVTFTNQFGTEITLNYNDKVKLNDGTITWVGNLKVGETFFHESYGDNVPITIETIVKVKEEPEVALCALGAIPYDHIDEDDDEAYFEAMYLTLKMIDYCIYNNTYVLPHIKVTAQARMNAGVGLCGVATHMARKKLRYDTKEGLEELHRVAERHMYMAIKASLKIAKERGSAPWIHKTKWIDGWLPIDTANKAVESLGNFQYRYDWESLREEIKANGGIGHSCLVAYMPSESSSKSLQSTNSVYPVRDVVLGKTDNSITINWAAPDSDDKSLHYHSAWDVNEIDMIKAYAVMQKFVDQTISADLWRRVSKADKVPSTELLNQYFNMVKYGMKTRYYYNSNVSNGVDLTTQVDNGLSDKTELTSNVNDGPDCEGCSM